MEKNYNYIFSQLVQNQNDIVGHIAYSLYKTQKIEHIQAYKDKHGTDPVDHDLITFHSVTSSSSSLESYKMKAEIILQEFINQALNETISEMREEITKNQADILRDIISPIKPLSPFRQFVSGVGQNIVAGIAFTLLVAVLLVWLQAKDKGLEDVAETSLGIEITKKQSKEVNKLDTTIMRDTTIIKDRK